ncbi:hypothetical protein ACEPAI_9783 [Sanghuangporus weigelae]
MDRLPFEILSDIFLRAILPPAILDLKLPRVRAESINIAPFRISLVCRFWREVALNDGQLWSHLFLGGWAVDWPKIGKPIFDVCLARSKEVPLNYRILLNATAQNYNESTEIANQLVSQQHRWRDVHFSWYKICLSGDNHEFHLTNMPMLTSLALDFGSPLHFTIDFGQSPQLRRVTIGGDFDLLPIQRPLQLLTLPSRLIFEGMCLEKSAIVSCLNFLKAAIFLEELVICFSDIFRLSTSPSNDNRQIVTGLRRLRLNYARGILDNVALPSLEVFKFGSVLPEDGEDGSEVLVDFFRRSRPPLTYLVLIGVGAHEDIIIPILRMLPTLRHLELQDANVSARLYDELTVKSHTICPAIESLQITHHRHLEDEAVCADALAVMLKSRAQIMDSFKTVQLGSASRNAKTIETARLGGYGSELKELYLWITVGETPKESFASTKVRNII